MLDKSLKRPPFLDTTLKLRITSEDQLFAQSKLAFTLVEVLIVMVIIGILIGLAVFGLSAGQKASKSQDKTSAMNQVVLSVDSYYNLNRKYPCVSGADVDSASGVCPASPITDAFIQKISTDAALRPAKGTSWGEYTYTVKTGTYYVSIKEENTPSTCDQSYYGGGVTSSGQNYKKVFSSVGNSCWLN